MTWDVTVVKYRGRGCLVFLEPFCKICSRFTNIFFFAPMLTAFISIYDSTFICYRICYTLLNSFICLSPSFSLSVSIIYPFSLLVSIIYVFQLSVSIIYLSVYWSVSSFFLSVTPDLSVHHYNLYLSISQYHLFHWHSISLFACCLCICPPVCLSPIFIMPIIYTTVITLWKHHFYKKYFSLQQIYSLRNIGTRWDSNQHVSQAGQVP